MELMQVRRWQADGEATVGQFFINGSQYCHCLEPALVRPYHNDQCKCCKEPHPRIPAGRYRVGLRDSPAFGKQVPEILKVPDRPDVLLHIGNYPKDTKACFCPGLRFTPGRWEVLDSGAARDHIYTEVRRAVHENEEVWIDVVDAFDQPAVVA